MDSLAEALAGTGIRSLTVSNGNGLELHVLEAGRRDGENPTVLLLHGFPELAYSWRKIMPRLADAGYHVIAPDQRGYGLTAGWDADYDGDLAQYRPLNLARDMLGLVRALGLDAVYLAGHDFGSPVAAWCGLIRPDVFRRVALLSAPYAGPPAISQSSGVRAAGPADLAADLANLPRPRKHYQHYYTSREANQNMWHAPQGVHDLLRAYYHHKSADWPGNRPRPLASASAADLAEMPTYYLMDLSLGMAETVAQEMPDTTCIRSNEWLPDVELRVYSEAFERTGFQGGLNWYRARSLGRAEQELFSGRILEQPTLFIAGSSDWGPYQAPGVLERMDGGSCADLRGIHLLQGAGHWVQQEQPEATARLLIEFFSELAAC